MSETAVTPETPTLRPHPETAVPAPPTGEPVPGEAPRLGSGPLAAPAPIDPTVEAPAPAIDAAPTLPDDAPVLPATAPVLPATPQVVAPAPPEPTTAEPTTAEERFAVNAMQFDEGSLPTLPDTVAVVPTVSDEPEPPSDDADGGRTADADADGEPEHPMAHLMPKKAKPTEASIRAAEQRALKKAKARKIKIGVFVGALAVSALAGPPLVSWVTDAINESGSTTTETGE